MPIVLPGDGAGPVASTNPLVSDVVNSVSDDLLQRIAPENPLMLDWVNRVQLKLLRVSRWQFLLSPPQRFVTQLGRTDYWVGPAGTAPIDTVDTGLGISSMGPIKTETFYDRTNFRLLKRTAEPLLSSAFAYRDGNSRQGPPRTWRCAPDTPSTINLYPAPDNQNNYQPVPEAPALSSIPGGALTARIYYVRTSYVDSLGNEGAASNEARVFIPANSLLLVQPPQEPLIAASGVAYDRYNVYAANIGTNTTLTTANETLQPGGPFSNSTAFQEPNTGITSSGLSPSGANNLEPMGGYLIEFRYFQPKPQVTQLTDPLVIPFDYFDVMVAGVNFYAAKFLKQNGQAVQDEEWQREFQDGITGMIRDKNLFPRAPEFIKPDPTSQGISNWYGFETFDPGMTSGI
jgi:hypothetical protein